jgi:microcystin degradation protein MlrC
MPASRILVAGLFHETNTFAQEKTGLEDFSIRRGKEILATRGDASPLGAMVELAEKLGWHLIPTIDYRATPSGLVRAEVIAQFRTELLERVRAALNPGLDGVYLVLHGAMVAEGVEDVEGQILEDLRALPEMAALPIFGVLDLHANVSSRMARLATGLVAYRKNPHTDAAQTAVNAGLLLQRALRGETPTTYLRQAPIVWPATGTATADRPMTLLEEAARELEKEGHWAVNVFPGFAHADTPDTGVSFTVITDRPAKAAETALARLEEIAWAEREHGFPREWNLNAALDQAANVSDRPVLIVEPSDNIGGGAPGDGTSILRTLLERRHPSAGVIVNDPAAVASLARFEPGARTTLEVGGKGSPLDPGPVKLEVELLRRSDGSFELEDPHSHLASMVGKQIEMGPCALVRHEGITILLTSRKTPPFDLGQWRSQGVDPEDLGVIGVKAAVAHRQAYDPIATASYTVETPGPCTSNLSLLPYRRLRRPIFPLDSV